MKKTNSTFTTFFRNVNEKGFFNLLSANTLVQIVAFGSQIFVAGILSPDDVGRIKVLQTFFSIFTIIGGMGFNSSTLKLCSERVDESEKRRIFKSGFFFTILSTGITYVVVLIINSADVMTSDKLVRQLVPLALFPLVSNSLFSVFVSYFLARKQVKLISRLTVINKLLAVVGIVLLTYFLGIKGYYWAYNLSIIIILAACFRREKSSYSLFSDITDKSSRKELFRLHWKYSRPSFMTTLFADLSAYADILILNFLVKDMFEIGYYGFALTLTVVLRMIPSTVQQITLPYFSEMATRKTEFVNAYKRYSKLLVLIILGTFAVVVLVAVPSLPVLFSGKYGESLKYFIPLSVGWSILMYNQIQSAALFGLGRMDYTAYGQISSLFFNLVVILVGWYFFGLIGVAYSSIVGAIFKVSIHYVFLKRQINGMM